MCKLIITTMLFCAIAVNADLVTNGSFEAPDVRGASVGFVRMSASNPIDGWLVLEKVDLIHELWTSPDGLQSLDLNASSQGKIAQKLDTVVGAIYELQFQMAGNPTTPHPPYLKEMRVMVADLPTGAYNASQNYAFDVGNTNYTNMGWQQETWLFTAEKTATWLIFENLTGGECGVAIDDVAVELVQLPEPITILLLGLGGLIARRR